MSLNSDVLQTVVSLAEQQGIFDPTTKTLKPGWNAKVEEIIQSANLVIPQGKVLSQNFSIVSLRHLSSNSESVSKTQMEQILVRAVKQVAEKAMFDKLIELAAENDLDIPMSTGDVRQDAGNLAEFFKTLQTTGLPPPPPPPMPNFGAQKKRSTSPGPSKKTLIPANPNAFKMTTDMLSSVTLRKPSQPREISQLAQQKLDQIAKEEKGNIHGNLIKEIQGRVSFQKGTQHDTGNMTKEQIPPWVKAKTKEPAHPSFQQQTKVQPRTETAKLDESQNMKKKRKHWEETIPSEKNPLQLKKTKQSQKETPPLPQKQTIVQTQTTDSLRSRKSPKIQKKRLHWTELGKSPIQAKKNKPNPTASLVDESSSSYISFVPSISNIFNRIINKINWQL